MGARWRGLVDRARSGAGDPCRGVRSALLCALDRDWSGTEAALQAITEEDSTQVDVYLALARVFRVRGEIGRAIRVHQNLLLRSDVSPAQREQALRGLAEDFRQGGFLERASASWEELLAQRPRDPAALRALVRLHRDARRPERALELAKRLHRVSGAGGEGRREEAALLLEMAERAHTGGRAEEARRLLRRARRRDPASAGAHVLLGEIEVERGRSKRALAAWRRALALDRRRGAALFPKLRSAFASLGHAAAYEPFLRERLRELPGDAETRLELARMLLSRGETQAGLAELRGLLESAPDHLEAHVERARALATSGELESACAAYADLAERLEKRGALRPFERGVE